MVKVEEERENCITPDKPIFLHRKTNNHLLWKVWFQKQRFVIVLMFIINLNLEENMLEHRKQCSLEQKLIRLYQLSLTYPLLTILLYGLYQAEFTLWQPCFKDSSRNQHSADGYNAGFRTALHSRQPRLKGKLKTPVPKTDPLMATFCICGESRWNLWHSTARLDTTMKQTEKQMGK